MLDDLRYAVRGFARSRIAAVVLIGSLGLGTGANAILYGVMDALLFQPPRAVSEPSRLVTISTSQFNGSPNGPSSYPDFLTLQADASRFESLAAEDDSSPETIRLGDAMHRVRVAAVSEDYFFTLGLSAHSGRVPIRQEAASVPPPAVISFALWKLAGSREDLLGTELHVAGRPHRIVGIAQPGFDGLQLGRDCHVWIPLTPADRARGRGERRLSIVGRLSPGADLASSRIEIDRIAAALASRYPETNRGSSTDADQPRRMTAVAYSRLDPSIRAQTILIGAVVFGATGLLLVSACTNAGTVLLSRTISRRRELAVKLALGASRRVLVRQIVVESLLVALVGGGFGLLLAHWTAGILPAQLTPEEAEVLDTRLDIGAVAVTFAFACLAGVLFAIGPARQATQTIDTEVLRADSSGVSTPGRLGIVRSLVVAGQVALSTLLLIAAGLLIRSLSLALEGELGADSRRIAIALVRLPGVRQGDVARGIRFHRAALGSLQDRESAEAAGWIATLPLVRGSAQTLEIDVGTPGLTEVLDAEVNVAGGSYFEAMKLPLVAGRLFDATDGALARPVAIVNDVLAQRYSGSAAVGRTLRDAEGTVFEIVGVVRSGRYRTLQDAPAPMVYFALSQRTPEFLHLLVRTRGDPDELVRTISERLSGLDRAATVVRATSLDRHLYEVSVLDRLLTTVVAACGLAALVLATAGVYGVIDDRVRRRTPEIGLRVALGASRAEIRRLVFVEGLQLALAGSIAGGCAALVLARVVRVFVHGLPPVGFANLAVAPLALLTIVLCAAIVPTRRALRISPTIALRAEA